jgi:hypothetical protein
MAQVYSPPPHPLSLVLVVMNEKLNFICFVFSLLVFVGIVLFFVLLFTTDLSRDATPSFVLYAYTLLACSVVCVCYAVVYVVDFVRHFYYERVPLDGETHH